MQMRALGSTDLSLSVVGIGTWAMGGAGWVGSWGPQNDSDSMAAIRRGIELGANWLDTAPIYGFGHAEEVVGRTLKGMGARPLVATKLSRAWDEHGKVSGNLKRAHVRRSVEASLRRLGLERLDLYQVHWPDPDPDIEEAWGAIAEVHQEGKIRHAGVCNFSIRQLERIRPIHPVASVQLPYSLLNRTAEALLAYCAQHRIGVVTYSPMEQGLLAGRFTKDRIANLHPEDHRRREAQFQEPAADREPRARRGTSGDRRPERTDRRSTRRGLGAPASRGDRDHCRRPAAGSDRRDGAGRGLATHRGRPPSRRSTAGPASGAAHGELIG